MAQICFTFISGSWSDCRRKGCEKIAVLVWGVIPTFVCQVSWCPAWVRNPQTPNYKKEPTMIETTSFYVSMRYKPEGRGFSSRWCYWNFFFWRNPSGRTMTLGSTQPLTKKKTRNISWGVKAAGVPPCADCLEIYDLQTLGALRACPGL